MMNPVARLAISTPNQAPIIADLPPIQPRVVNGELGTREQLRGTVALIKTSQGIDPKGELPLCSGVLIHPRIVLIAAHCFGATKNPRPDPVDAALDRSIAANWLDASPAGRESLQISNVKQVVWHRKSANFLSPRDIAIVILEEPIANMKSARIAVSRGHMPVGDVMQISGYGDTLPGACPEGGWEQDVCFRNGFSEIQQVTRRNIYINSAKTDTTPDRPCNGDSGGPLYVNDENIDLEPIVAGITNVAANNLDDPSLCAQRFAEFARVAAYLPWIKRVIRKEGLTIEKNGDGTVSVVPRKSKHAQPTLRING